MHKEDLAVYGGLMAATAGYAALLETYNHLWEPEYTWVEVLVGTSLCLGAAALRARAAPGATWQQYERYVWRAFVLGGVPVIAWQIGQDVVRSAEARHLRRKGWSDEAPPLAK